jgi:hypothetical protein
MHQKPTDKRNRKRGAQEPARTRRTAGLSGTSRTVRGDLADGPRLPCGRSAVTSRTVHQVRISTAEEHEKQPQTSIDGSPKPQGVLRRNFGEMMNTPRRGYAPKITASNILQLPESQILAKNTMTSGSSKSQRIEGQIRRLRGQDHPQRGTKHSPMIPSKKSGEKPTQIRGITPRA